MSKKLVEVFIGGTSYKLSGPEDEEYIKTVASYVDKKISEMRSLKPTGAINNNVHMLLALNIADELFKLRADISENADNINIDEHLDNYYKEFHKIQEENILLKEKITELQLEIRRIGSKLP